MANNKCTFIVDDTESGITEVYNVATAEEAVSQYINDYFNADSDYFKSYSVDVYKVSEAYKAKIDKKVLPQPYFATIVKAKK